MKKLQILITIAFIFSTISLNVFAEEPKLNQKPGVEQNGSNEQNTKESNEKKDKCNKCDKDPLKRLEERKENIQKEYKEGKISKEKADELTEKINKHIQNVKEFDSLTLPQKKEHILAKVKSHVEQDIKDGKITKEEGERKIKDFTKELEKWDGRGFPKSIGKGDKHKK